MNENEFHSWTHSGKTHVFYEMPIAVHSAPGRQSMFSEPVFVLDKDGVEIETFKWHVPLNLN